MGKAVCPGCHTAIEFLDSEYARFPCAPTRVELSQQELDDIRLALDAAIIDINDWMLPDAIATRKAEGCAGDNAADVNQLARFEALQQRLELLEVRDEQTTG